ncbi:MAG TPA: methyltransferase domain-containing protein [Candidatus Binatia bacterium]|nr:methyltransferase domain-containing protein [Candidatus Binatia bacterium]
MAVKFTSKEISRKYDRFARWYDWVEGVPDVLGLSRLRRRLLKRASGKVLEIAVGTGKNLRFYPSGCGITALDVSNEMLNVARRRAAKLSTDVSFLLGNAETLPFPDNSFDTVVSSLTTCTFPDPLAALGEMRRVCKSEGKILLLEHGRSDREWLARFQDRTAHRLAKQLGCHWNRESLELVRKANLRIKEARRLFFGVFHQIEAEPGLVEKNRV